MVGLIGQFNLVNKLNYLKRMNSKDYSFFDYTTSMHFHWI